MNKVQHIRTKLRVVPNEAFETLALYCLRHSRHDNKYTPVTNTYRNRARANEIIKDSSISYGQKKEKSLFKDEIQSHLSEINVKICLYTQKRHLLWSNFRSMITAKRSRTFNEAISSIGMYTQPNVTHTTNRYRVCWQYAELLCVHTLRVLTEPETLNTPKHQNAKSTNGTHTKQFYMSRGMESIEMIKITEIITKRLHTIY